MTVRWAFPYKKGNDTEVLMDRTVRVWIFTSLLLGLLTAVPLAASPGDLLWSLETGG